MKGYVCSEFLPTARHKGRCHICREPKSAHRPKPIIKAIRGVWRKPKTRRSKISKTLFIALVEALKDSAPLPESTHFECKDEQHKECVMRIATALGRIATTRQVPIDDYINHFTFVVRGGF